MLWRLVEAAPALGPAGANSATCRELATKLHKLHMAYGQVIPVERPIATLHAAPRVLVHSRLERAPMGDEPNLTQVQLTHPRVHVV